MYTCKKCSQTKPQDMFYPKNKSRCRACISIDNKTNRKAMTVEELQLEAIDRKAYYKLNWIDYRYNDMVKRATNKDLECSVSRSFMADLVLRQNYRCGLTGKTLDIDDKRYSPSVERIDSSKGYTEDNVMWVCSMVNIMKNEFTSQEFLEMCQMVVNKHNKELGIVPALPV